MIRISSALILLLSILQSPAETRKPAPGPARIILLRHAEKPNDQEDPHLSPAGVKRAARLVAFIMTDPVMSSAGRPVAIFATESTKHDRGQRTQETVAPLARALKLPVLTPFHGKQYRPLAKQILSTPAYAGKTVLICWNHEEIPALAQALGVTPAPAKWKGSVFDEVYVITYANGRATLNRYRYKGK